MSSNRGGNPEKFTDAEKADQELIILAARAAYIELTPYPFSFHGMHLHACRSTRNNWNNSIMFCPLYDNGDALELAIELKMIVNIDEEVVTVDVDNANGEITFSELRSDHSGNLAAATRRAIVRAAAEIGRRP
jgi:hypothetical protein